MSAHREPPPNAPQGERGGAIGRREGRTDARIVIAVAGPLVFAPPALALADRGALFGVPSLVIYVFAAWTLGIVLTAMTAVRQKRRR